MRKTAQRLWRKFKRRLNKPSKRLPPMELVIPLDSERIQKFNRFASKSGAKRRKDLVAGCLDTTERLVDHELRGGTIVLFDEKGVAEELSVLEIWNDPAEDWKNL
jgi:hypothetical protein